MKAKNTLYKTNFKVFSNQSWTRTNEYKSKSISILRDDRRKSFRQKENFEFPLNFQLLLSHRLNGIIFHGDSHYPRWHTDNYINVSCKGLRNRTISLLRKGFNKRGHLFGVRVFFLGVFFCHDRLYSDRFLQWYIIALGYNEAFIIDHNREWELYILF